MLMPAVVAVPVLLNCAILPTTQAAGRVLGVQFVLVYHAVVAPAFVQAMVCALAAVAPNNAAKHAMATKLRKINLQFM